MEEFNDKEHIKKMYKSRDDQNYYTNSAKHFDNLNDLYLASQQNMSQKKELLKSMNMGNEHITSDKKIFATLSPGYPDTRQLINL